MILLVPPWVLGGPGRCRVKAPNMELPGLAAGHQPWARCCSGPGVELRKQKFHGLLASLKGVLGGTVALQEDDYGGHTGVRGMAEHKLLRK